MCRRGASNIIDQRLDDVERVYKTREPGRSKEREYSVRVGNVRMVSSSTTNLYIPSPTSRIGTMKAFPRSSAYGSRFFTPAKVKDFLLR